MTRPTLILCRDPIAAHWELGRLPVGFGRLTLIGWRVGDRDEGGMPASVGDILARAMTEVARVTFPSGADPVADGEWTTSGEDLVRKAHVSGTIARFRGRLDRTPTAVVQLSTRRASAAKRLFDDPAYPWWLGGQAALLSDADASPPTLDARSWLALLGREWSADAAALGDVGVRGIVRAGADGDVFGFLGLDAAFAATFLAAIETAARVGGFDVADVDEGDFG